MRMCALQCPTSAAGVAERAAEVTEEVEVVVMEEAGVDREEMATEARARGTQWAPASWSAKRPPHPPASPPWHRPHTPIAGPHVQAMPRAPDPSPAPQ